MCFHLKKEGAYHTLFYKRRTKKYENIFELDLLSKTYFGSITNASLLISQANWATGLMQINHLRLKASY